MDKTLYMTPELWEVLANMMNSEQMKSFIGVIEDTKDVLVSDEVVTNCIEDLGGAGRVLFMLNSFTNMGKLFRAINIALEARGKER